MAKKKQESKGNGLAPKKNFIDNLKFMQLSKDAVLDKKNKHKRREDSQGQ